MADKDERAAKRIKTNEGEDEGVPSNDATSIQIVNDDDLSKFTSFHPAFTYHAFGKEEVIHGYRGLQIKITLSAKTFDCHVDVEYDHKDNDADDLIERMANSLPKGFTRDKKAFLQSLGDGPFKPAGSLVDTYSTNDKTFSTHYSVLSDDPQGKAYLEKMQKLSLYFIEGADDVDVEDSRWSLYVIYETTHGDHRPVGYITVFTFHTPFTIHVGHNMRICQVLVLPPYQRQGHGERLVEHIMHQARSMKHVHEVTVEDPVPGFSMLRDVVDVKTCLSHGFFSVPPTGEPTCVAHGTRSLTAEGIAAVKQSLKLTKQQTQRCYEVLKLRFLDRSNEEQYKAFRLEVKRRLHTLHAEDLEAMGSADRRKGLLATLYEELEANYDRILKRCGLLPRTA
ncbi:Aste57867_11660 [Aphanomyces stellatus]|uniref:histone acetyltransferase n=1 Tax=Aphanomyces stellatus TaxID=120398 RepID=A0A485KU27_9STRA|nr:hypothetical protein As57867_011617 [Aphanomyces stellatus]VFT88518.1 Aste57867_11660 [Aphanomyces stellatus]